MRRRWMQVDWQGRRTAPAGRRSAASLPPITDALKRNLFGKDMPGLSNNAKAAHDEALVSARSGMCPGFCLAGAGWL